MKNKKRKWLLISAVLLMILLLLILDSRRLEVTHYTLPSNKLAPGQSIRLAVLADLHNREFGEGNSELIRDIREQKPDLIIMAGDMFTYTEEDTQTVQDLSRHLVELAPVYFGLGNHESAMIFQYGMDIHETLEEIGVNVLISEDRELRVNGVLLSIGSISGSETEYDEWCAGFVEEFAAQTEPFKLMISHVPSLYYEKMADTPLDLGICGHYHGGQVRIPGLGGVFSMLHGLFPKYCDGMFQLENSVIFVSRGLGSSHKVPRINNRPELAIIDIKPLQ